jgi:hypothetical protein
MPPLRRQKNVPDLLLERFRLGELCEAARAYVAGLAAGDPEVATRLRALEASDTAIGREPSMQDLARAVRTRAARQARPRRVKAIGVIALAGAAAAIVLAVMWRPETGDRIKGLTPSLVVYRQTPQGSEQLADNTLAHARDLLRLGYIAAEAPYGVIVSVDGRGIVTTHLPKSGSQAAALSAGAPVLLDEAYELDDAPRIERFYFVTGASAFAVAVVKDAATRAAAGRPGNPPVQLTLPKDLSQFTIAVRKE